MRWKEKEDIVVELKFIVRLDTEQLKLYVNGAGCIVISNEVEGRDDKLEENYVYWLDETVGEI